MSEIHLTVNATKRVVNVDDDTPLVWVLRDTLSLTGTKFGCGMGLCGSCTILENGKAVRSCQIPASEAKGRNFVTIEGLSREASHPCQRAWLEEDAAGQFQPNGWIRINSDGTVTLTIGKSEMGQGVRTSLAMILADELEVEWAHIKLIQASPGPDFKQLDTGRSSSIASSWKMLRP